MAPSFVKRITLFKVPKEEDIDAILGQYEIMRTTAEKVSISTASAIVQYHIYLEEMRGRPVSVLFATLMVLMLPTLPTLLVYAK